MFLGFPDGAVVKNPPAMQEMGVQSLDRDDPLEEKMATHSSVLFWRIPWTEEPGGLQSMGSQRVGHDRAHAHTHTHTHARARTILCLQNVLSCLTAQDAIKYKLEMIGVLNMALVERKKVKCDLGQSHHFSDPQVPQPQNTLQMLKDHTGE